MCSYIKEEIQNRIEDKIDKLYINCPECENMDDEQYQCGLCGSGGGNGNLYINEYLRIVNL